MPPPFSRPTPPAPAEPLIAPDEQNPWIDPYDVTYKRRWAALIALLAVTVVVLYPAMQASLLWGDALVITENPALRSWRALAYGAAHPSAATTFYHPLAEALLLPQYRLWGGWNPGGYHGISLALHLLNVALFWLILRRLRVRGVILAAALFALHPTSVQAVAWTAKQPAQFAAFLSFLATLVWLRVSGITAPPPTPDDALVLPRPTWPRQVLFAILFAAALLCDATVACMLPAALLAVRWWYARSLKRRDFVVLLPAIALSIALTSIVAATAQRAPDLPGRFTFRLLAVGFGILWHLWTLVDPFPLLFAYRGGRDLPWGWHIVVLAMLVVGFVLLTRRRRRGAAVFVAAVVFVSLLLPRLLIVAPPQASWLFDTQSYLARAALFTLFAAWITRVLAYEGELSLLRRTMLPLAFVIVVTDASALSWRVGKGYADERTLWANVARHDPALPLAHAQLAAAMIEQQDLSAAADQFEQLIALDRSATWHMRLAELRMQQQRPGDAVKLLRTAVELRPNDPTTHRQLASALAATHDPAGAEFEFHKALDLDPRDDLARNNLGTFLANQGRIDEAIVEYQRAIGFNPNSSMAHLHLASLLFNKGQFDAAAEHLQTAVRIDPGNYDAYMMAGQIQMEARDFASAARMFNAAVMLRQEAKTKRGQIEQAQAFNALGVSLMTQGNMAEAIYNFGRAVDLLPDYAEAKHNLATAQAQRDARPATRP